MRTLADSHLKYFFNIIIDTLLRQKAANLFRGGFLGLSVSNLAGLLFSFFCLKEFLLFLQFYFIQLAVRLRK